ncbi:MAG: hypothetical protein M5U34_16670 [Chloroflexi bacterium]|nr:hypothetical protein [Chloroflexota bacterium]
MKRPARKAHFGNTMILFETANDWSRKTPSEAQEFFVSLAEQLNLDTARFAQELNDGVYAGICFWPGARGP